MNGFQKTIKIFAICLAIFIIVNIVGGILSFLAIVTGVRYMETNDTIQVESFVGEYKNIDKIDIDSVSSNIIIKPGNEFKVEANNLKNRLSSNEMNGTLRIKEEKAWFWNSNNQGSITIYVPIGITLNELKIDSGAGKIEIENINVDEFDLEQGAGVVEIEKSKFNKTNIDGGAGEIKIKNSTLNNLKMDAGIGKIDVEAEITGNSKIDCGIGDMRITLLGNEEDYDIRAEKGIGNIQINNKRQENDVTYGSGKNKIKLEGGVGNIEVNFSARVM